jgi:hypothetical protein
LPFDFIMNTNDLVDPEPVVELDKSHLCRAAHGLASERGCLDGLDREDRLKEPAFSSSGIRKTPMSDTPAAIPLTRLLSAVAWGFLGAAMFMAMALTRMGDDDGEASAL